MYQYLIYHHGCRVSARQLHRFCNGCAKFFFAYSLLHLMIPNTSFNSSFSNDHLDFKFKSVCSSISFLDERPYQLYSLQHYNHLYIFGASTAFSERHFSWSSTTSVIHLALALQFGWTFLLVIVPNLVSNGQCMQRCTIYHSLHMFAS